MVWSAYFTASRARGTIKVRTVIGRSTDPLPLGPRSLAYKKNSAEWSSLDCPYLSKLRGGRLEKLDSNDLGLRCSYLSMIGPQLTRNHTVLSCYALFFSYSYIELLIGLLLHVVNMSHLINSFCLFYGLLEWFLLTHCDKQYVREYPSMQVHGLKQPRYIMIHVLVTHRMYYNVHYIHKIQIIIQTDCDCIYSTQYF